LTGIAVLTAFSYAAQHGEQRPSVQAVSQSRLIEYLIIDYPSISPNGDGVKDFSAVKIRLKEPCDTLSVTLEDSLMAQLYDTLLYVVGPDSGVYTTAWEGVDSLGAPLDDGTYKIVLYASNTDTAEYHIRSVIVDVTAPVIALDRIEPGIYTPLVPGSEDKVLIYFTVNGYKPGDSTEVTLNLPGDETERLEPDITADGAYTLQWADDNAPDGFYSVSFYMYDPAGNSTSDEGFFEVDAEGPDLGFIEPLSGKMESVPQFVEGYCYDRNGIDSLMLSLNSDTSFFFPDYTYWRGDTLVWRYGIADTVTTEDDVEVDYALGVRSTDVFGHVSQDEMSFTIDRKDPESPVLDQPDSPVYDPEVDIRVTVDYPDTDSLVIYRVFLGDTATTGHIVTKPVFTITVPIEAWLWAASRSRLGMTPPEPTPEPNYIWMEALDALDHRSGPSNVVMVAYDNRPGLGFPEAFKEPDVFRIMTKTDAREAEINIFTLNGENVRKLKEWGPATKFELEWDLTNDDGEEVRNGAYLVVITVRYYNSKWIDKYFIAVAR
jgi:flagellar hook assembly protein FlgD